MEYYKVPAKIRTVTNQDLMRLPKGFRFHPTDEELILHYLIPKALNSTFRAAAICQADFNKCEPWDLPKKGNMGESERYYYCQRDRKYQSGLRTNRATKAGYWKATGKDKGIYKRIGDRKELIGMKKTLVFYIGRAPNGEKTNWVMHEFRLQQNGQFSSIPKDDGWVISRVFHKIDTKAGDNENHTRMDIENSAALPAHISDSLSTDRIIDKSKSLPDLVDPSKVLPSSKISHPNNSSIGAYDDPNYYFPSLFETFDSLEMTCAIIDDYKCKMDQQQCSSSSAINAHLQDTISNNVEVLVDCQEYDDDLIPLSSTLSSMQDLLKLWK